jgi:hypothetical protein
MRPGRPPKWQPTGPHPIARALLVRVLFSVVKRAACVQRLHDGPPVEQGLLFSCCLFLVSGELSFLKAVSLLSFS